MVGNSRAASASPLALVGIAVAIGAVLRGLPILGSDFPVGDGGLFAQMALDIRSAGFTIPAYSSFNYGDIPFAYPPLGLYLLAILPGDPIFTERWLPFVWSLAAIVVAYLAARALTDEKRAGIATILFAVIPVTWTIEGAGAVRGLALILVLATFWRVAVMVNRPSAAAGAALGMMAGLALLTHPSTGPTIAASSLAIFAFSPSRRALAYLVLAAAVAGLVAAPWVALVIVRYGVGALVAAGGAHNFGATLPRLIEFGPAWLSPVDIVLWIAVIGALSLAWRRQWLLPVWVLLLLVVPGGQGRHAAIVWALLAAEGVLTAGSLLPTVQWRQWTASAALALLVAMATTVGLLRFQALPKPARVAAVEMGRALPNGSQVAVRNTVPALQQPLLDWFPVLSGLRSVNTYMGLEWTSDARWDEVVDLDMQISNGYTPEQADGVFELTDGGAHWWRTR